LPYYTYILKSLTDDGYYYGHCENLKERLKRHNAGKVRSTKSRRPFIIHYFEEYPTKTESAKREYFFKTIEGYKFLRASGII
jgi:putative endonuclease